MSYGKDIAGEFGGSFRVPAERAWAFPSIELRTPTSYPLLIFDIDTNAADQTMADLWMFDELPAPSWTVTRTSTGNSHAVYCLASPVLRGANAKIKPLQTLARISEYYGSKFDSDVRYRSVLSHNPMAKAHGPEFRTWWGRVGGYSLDDLRAFIPANWRRPAMAQTAVGRNVDLFRACTKWAGSERHSDDQVLPIALRLNDQFDQPLNYPEVEGIARSVERYRAGWSFYTDEERREWGRLRGLKGGPKSGQARRKDTPLEHDRTPWESEGISRPHVVLPPGKDGGIALKLHS